ncbi:MAG: hypothetical protein NTY02_03765, partial [Acidobacteria bacterium]|nr:hypothetical protein [Acidobacteriota bacterium]
GMVGGFLHPNAANQLAVLRRYRSVLDQFERLLRHGSQDALERRLAGWQGQRAPRRPHLRIGSARPGD